MAEPGDDALQRYVYAVLQAPGVGIVAVLAAQRAAGEEDRDPDARPVQARAGLVGVQVAEGAFAFAVVLDLRRFGREIVAEIVAAAYREIGWRGG